MDESIMNDFDAFIGICILAVIGIALTLGGAIAMDYAVCTSKARAMSVEKTYGPLQGCVVKVNGRWLPIESVREVNP